MYTISKSSGQRILDYSIMLLTLIGVVLSLINGSILWLLPLVFFVVYTFTFTVLNVNFNWCIGIIVGISIIRYSLLPILYTVGLSSTFVSYITYNFKHLVATIIVMIIEMLGIFTGVYLADRRILNTKSKDDSVMLDSGELRAKTKDIGIASWFIIFLGFILLVTHPSLVRGLNQEVVNGNDISGSIEAVFQVSLIVLSIVLLHIIKYLRRTLWTKIVFTFFVFGLLIYLSSNMATSYSRNCLIINSIILLIYLMRNYNDKAYKLAPVVIVFAILFFCVSSYNRFSSYHVSSNIIYAVFSSMFEYQVLNAYFSGPTNIDMGITMISNHNGIIGPGQFVIDFFANVPLINKLFSGMNTVTMYNYSLSHGIANDQIVPLTIQSIAYGSYLMTPILAFITSYLSVTTYYKASKASNDLLLYCYSYIAIVFAMGTMLCVNSISMLIIMRIVPVLIIGRLNIIVIIGER